MSDVSTTRAEFSFIDTIPTYCAWLSMSSYQLMFVIICNTIGIIIVVGFIVIIIYSVKIS